MNRRKVMLIFILLVLISVVNSSIKAVEDIGWVAGGEISVLTLSREHIMDQVMLSQKLGHLNTIYVTVKQFDGRIWYYSEKYAEVMTLPGNGMSYSYKDNPLQKVINRAHSESPHQAVMVLFQAFNDKYAAENLFPEARIPGTDWVDPAYKPMQDYLIDLATDLVKHYPIDGLSLDSIRYPSGVRDSSLPITKNRNRVEVLTDFLQRFVAVIRGIDSRVDISTNVFAETVKTPVTQLGQDISKFSEIVDFVSPMLYPYTDDQQETEESLYKYQNVEPKFSTEPGITFLSDNWLQVRWDTIAPTGASISLFQAGEMIKTVEHAELTIEHSVWFRDLTGDTDYQVVIQIVDPYGQTVEKQIAVKTLKNLALGAIAEVSSVTHAGFEGDKVLDNDLSTRWCSTAETDLDWITIDLGGVKEIQGVGLEWEYAYARKFIIQYSVDGYDWETIYVEKEGTGGRQDIFFDAVQAQFVKLIGVEKGTDLGYSLWEVKVYQNFMTMTVEGGREMYADRLLKKMTLEEKVGQLFQIGFTGTTVTPEIKEMIEDYHIGGVIYFRRNISSLEQVTRLSNELQRLAMEKESGVPLFISTDQEGGIVTRLTGGTHFPGNMALGAAGDIELARKAGQAVARELRGAGINMNLAPVLDVNNNPENPIIGVRSFGEDPQQVAALGTAFIQGMQAEGVIACGNHFPGHCDTDTDSHLDLPIIRHERERLEEVEFYPFKEAIKAGLDSIMTAHIYFPAIESEEGIPATLSHAVLTDLLRKEMGYEGLIITDCMEMDAIVSTFGTVEGSIMTLNAGSDMVLISHTLNRQKNAIKAVIEAVRSGRISEERIEESVRRILEIKEKRFGLTDQLVADWQLIDLESDGAIAYEIAKKAVTLVQDVDGLLPITREEKVMIMEFNMGQLGLVEDKNKISSPLVSFLQKQKIDVKYHLFAKGDTQLPDLTGVEKIVICTYSVLQNPDQSRVVKEIYNLNIPVIVVSLRNPYDLQAFPEISTYLTTYDYSTANLLVASEILTGKSEAKGVLPITLDL